MSGVTVLHRKHHFNILTVLRKFRVMHNDIPLRKTRPCNIQRIFSAVKFENFVRCFNVLLKTQIVGTRKNRIAEAALTSIHSLCFRIKIGKIGIPLNITV